MAIVQRALSMVNNNPPIGQFYEFFAGGGMARAGAWTPGWKCLFANDIDRQKSRRVLPKLGPTRN